MALDVTRLELAPGSFSAIIGPSGCGKSTLLNAIAGFIAPASGQIRIDGRVLNGPDAQVGVIFQQYALFPWLTALGNVKFALKRFNLSRAERHRRAIGGAGRGRSRLAMPSLSRPVIRRPKTAGGYRPYAGV